MDEIKFLEWPAMMLMLVGAWFVASRRSRRRHAGFWLFLVSNVLWMGWGVAMQADAFVVLQVCLGAINIRGLHKSSETEMRRGWRPQGTQ